MTHTLLVADDSVTVHRVLELTFAGGDVHVVAVRRGDEAMARIREARPDVVLADVRLPVRSGYELSAFVKGTPELAHIPVLLLANAFEPLDEARAARARCDGVLVKPFEPRDASARVRDLLARRAPRSAAPPEGGRRDDTRDEYFARLDAAVARGVARAAGRAQAAPPPGDPASPPTVPTVEALIRRGDDVPDEVVDALARRVLDRLTPEGLRALVSRIVADVAGPLIREELDRNRKAR